jgi:hypothetical protein
MGGMDRPSFPFRSAIRPAIRTAIRSAIRAGFASAAAGLRAALVLAAALGAPGPARADTEVCGTYELATEWTAHDSPYLVTGDIFIPATSRLRIGPGVVVRFAKPRPCELQKRDIDQEDWSDSMYTGIKAEGTLYVLGSEDKPVVFEPADAKPGTIGWDGLRLSGQKAGMAEIAFATFRGANQAVTAEKSGFFIHHCLFEGNNTGVWAGMRGDVGIVNCDFIGNQSAGIVIRKAGPRIAGNIFLGNRSYGIWADGRPAIQAMYNAFWANREEACYKCPYSVLDTTKKNANGDAVDAAGNLSADPLFIGSPGYDAAREADVAEATPAHLVKDPELAKLEADARAKAEAKAKKKKKRKKEYEPLGQGPYVLSKYSRLIDAGHPGKDFRDRDGSRNDIGLHGGPMGRIATDPF